MFQSLFCWMLFQKDLSVSVWLSDIRFQSLFCWMLFQKGQSEGIDCHSVISFNPYSVGCYFRSELFSIHFVFSCVVSILILLDVISEETAIQREQRIVDCFNPYSVGCYFRSLAQLANDS